MKKIRIGAGAGYSGDRIEPAVALVEYGQLDYIAFECLAERTIALAQQARMNDPESGFDPLLAARMQAVLPACSRNGVKLITNMGAANPRAAAEKTSAIARSLGLKNLKIAYVTGDDVLEQIKSGEFTLLETGTSSHTLHGRLVSANAYLGVTPIVHALQAGADIIITGRVADPALFLAPLIHEFGWSAQDWDKLGQGTLVGHLLECAGQVTGGYFADPGYKEVPDLANLGFPIAEVDADGNALLTKLADAGGKVSLASCKEQLLYEIHDPSCYYTPDVIADFSQVRMIESGPNQVQIMGARGKPHSDTLKVSLGYRDGFIGEGQMSYAGPGAVTRAQLALEIVRQRLETTGVPCSESRYDLMGMNAIHPNPHAPAASEVRLRVAGRTDTLVQALRIGNEVESLYTNGPAGGGGASKSAREVIAILSVLIPRIHVHPAVHYLET